MKNLHYNKCVFIGLFLISSVSFALSKTTSESKAIVAKPSVQKMLWGDKIPDPQLTTPTEVSLEGRQLLRAGKMAVGSLGATATQDTTVCGAQPSNNQQLNFTIAGKKVGFNWVSTARSGVLAILGKVPEVGSLLASITGFIWPADKPNIWPSICGQVANLINETIANKVYTDVKAELGYVSSQVSNGVTTTVGYGLVGTIINYLNNPTNATFQVVLGFFTKNVVDFMQEGYQAGLLPYFAQFASLHLALLRDGVLNGWLGANGLNEFNLQIKNYQRYIQQWFLQGYADALKAGNGFNYMNNYVRQMQLAVTNFSNTWKYYGLNASLTPSNDVNKIFDNQIFETLSENLTNGLSPSNRTISLRPFIGGRLSQIVTANGSGALKGLTTNYSCGGLSNCIAASPAYPVHCTCNAQVAPGSQNSCFIQVGGLDPNATSELGGTTYINDLSTSSCCSVSNMPSTPGTSEPYGCRYFDTMDECEAALNGTSNSSSTSGYHGFGSPSGASTTINISAENPIVGVSGQYNSAGQVTYINFHFADGTSTNNIPNISGSDNFSIDHSKDGYILTSLYVPGGMNDQDGVYGNFYYEGAPDIVFGWKPAADIDNAVCAATPPATQWQLPDRITSTYCLSNASIHSLNGKYSFSQQGDGNFVVYDGGNAVWATNKFKSNSRLCMQDDGNLVAYTGNSAYWQSNTSKNSGTPPYTLVMQNDGNVVILDLFGQQIWQTKTTGK